MREMASEAAAISTIIAENMVRKCALVTGRK